MNKKIRRLRKNILTGIFDITPKKLRDYFLREQVILDYSPPSNLKFKLATTKSEMEQAYQLLYKSYVASGSMNPNESGLRITPYHSLPNTSMLIATFNDKVIATLSIFRFSSFGLPVAKVYDVSRFAKSGLRIAEISSLCVDDEFKNDHRTMLFGLLKYLYEYSVNFFGIDVKLIVIKPFRRHFYESMLCFQQLENRKIYNYDFSNGATVMAEFLDLNIAPELYKKIYSTYPDKQNLYKYFVETKLDNFIFPDRSFHTISDPVLTPELLNYFFIEKTNTLQNMSTFEIAVLKNQYKGKEFEYLFSNFLKDQVLPEFDRAEERFEIKSSGILLATGYEPNKIIQVRDVSRSGILIYSPLNLLPKKQQKICVVIGPQKYSYLSLEPKWKNGFGFYGYKILKNDATWDQFIASLEKNKFNRKVSA